MFSPQSQQIEICLLKSNLEEIENELVSQYSALPALDVENDHQYRETMTALKVARSVNAEAERLKQENVRLTAKRMQLIRQCEDMSGALKRVRETRAELEEALKQEERDEELEIRKYEDSLREKADRLRQTRQFYDEDIMSTETEKVNNVISELEVEMTRRQAEVDELRANLDGLTCDVPDDLLVILGKKYLEDELKFLADKCAALTEKRENLLKEKAFSRSAKKDY